MMLTLEIIQGLGFRGSLESLRAFQLGLTTSILTANISVSHLLSQVQGRSFTEVHKALRETSQKSHPGV